MSIPRLPISRQSPLELTGLPALLTLFGPEFQCLLSAQLPPASPLRGRLRLEQRHRLIRQQLTAGDLQPLAPAIPEGGPEVRSLNNCTRKLQVPSSLPSAS